MNESNKKPLIIIVVIVALLIGCCVASAFGVFMLGILGAESPTPLEQTSGASSPSPVNDVDSPLVGGWEFISTGVLVDFVDSSGNVVGGDASGSGTRLEFNADGTYAYHYYAKSGGILSGELKALESGRWVHGGTTLELRPSAIDGTAQFGDATPEALQFDPTPRQYQLTATDNQTAVQLHGPCAHFRVDTWCPVDDAERMQTPVSTTWKRAR